MYKWHRNEDLRFMQSPAVTPTSSAGHDRKAAMNEADLAGCGDVGEWLGVDSGKRTQVSATVHKPRPCLVQWTSCVDLSISRGRAL